MPTFFPNDVSLLRRFVSHGNEAAFREVVERHAPLVYGCACRRTGDYEAARDVAQQVFIHLARKARHVLQHPNLVGWLHRATIYETDRLLKRERRRKRREHQYSSGQSSVYAAPKAEAETDAGARLEAALARLNETERVILLLRYFEDQSHARIAAATGLTEDAVRQRASRALKKLGGLLNRGGLGPKAAPLLLQAAAVQAATSVPSGLAIGALKGAPLLTTAFPGGLFLFMKSSTIKIGVALAALGILIPAAWQWRERSSRLEQPVLTHAIRLAPTDGIPRNPPPKNDPGDFSEFDLRRYKKWMQTRGRDAACLVAMWDLTGDKNLLEEASREFPDDPRVCIAMMGLLWSNAREALPWTGRLIAAEPKNPAGYYWKAQMLAKAGRTEEGLEALRTASKVAGRPDGHLRNRNATVREAILASGGSIREAALGALAAPTGKPMLAGAVLDDLQRAIKAAKDAGDEDRMVDLAALGAASSEHLGMGNALLLMDEIAMQNTLETMLQSMPPDTEYGNAGKTAGSRLKEIEAEQQEVRRFILSGPDHKFISTLTDAQVSEYTDKVIIHGDLDALRWLSSLKTGTPRAVDATSGK